MAKESKANSSSTRVVTNVQNEDTSKKQNQDIVEETKTYYQTIAEEYDAGKITDESIKAACEKQNPPIDPEAILTYVHMTNLEREESPYYKSDLSDVKVTGTDYTVEPGSSVEVAGCTITATKYEGDAVKDTKNVFGLEALKAAAKRQAESDESWLDYAWEFFGGKSDSAHVKDSDWMPEERTLYHCSSPYLGEFDYDPTMYRIGYKEIPEKDGSVSQLPVLQYIGPNLSTTTGIVLDNTGESATSIDANWDMILDAQTISKNLVPEGCKILDYTYQSGNGTHGFNIEYVPEIPEGVTSMNCTFKGCNSLKILPLFENDGFDDNWLQRVTDTTTAGNYNLFKNENRVVSLPSTLECASSAFKGCNGMGGAFVSTNPEYVEYQKQFLKDVSEDGIVESAKKHASNEIPSQYIDQLPKGIVNTVDMFSGCEGLDEVYQDGYVCTVFDLPGSKFDVKSGKLKNVTFDKAKFGGNYTPYLAPELMRGIYDDISDSTVMARGARGDDVDKGYFKDDDVYAVIRQDGGLDKDFNPLGLDQDKLNQSRSAQMLLAEGKVDSAHVDTSAEVASSGMRANNKIKEADGSYGYDASGRKQSYQDLLADTAAPWEKLSMMAAVGLAGAAVGGLSTKNKWVALATGLGAGLGSSYLLPSTLYPVLSTTSRLLGIKKLQEFADKLPGAESYKANKEIMAHNKTLAKENAKWDNDYNVGKANFDDRISAVFGNATTQARTSMLVDKTCADSMFANGKASAQELNFAGIAMVGESEAKCVTDTMQTAIDAAKNKFEEKFAGKTSLTASEKKELSDYYVLLMQSLEAYSKGSKEGISLYDGEFEERSNLQMDGLGMVNRAYADTTMKSLKEMNDKYHFMNDIEWAKITSLDIEGVDTANLKAYQNSNYFKTVRDNAAGLTVEDIKLLASKDSQFKKAMGSDLKTVDERIPAGYVAQRVNEKQDESTTSPKESKPENSNARPVADASNSKESDEKKSQTTTRETIEIAESSTKDEEQMDVG